MEIRIDYLNKDKEVRRTFVDIKTNEDDLFLIGYEIHNILLQGATDVRVYKL